TPTAKPPIKLTPKPNGDISNLPEGSSLGSVKTEGRKAASEVTHGMIERCDVAHHVSAICVPHNIEAAVHHGHAVGWVDPHGVHGLEAAGEQIRGEAFCLKQLDRLGLARRSVVQRAEGEARDFFLQ